MENVDKMSNEEYAKSLMVAANEYLELLYAKDIDTDAIQRKAILLNGTPVKRV
jgi:hypothetical protein